MELQCPQCGKWMAVSQEELVIHDCQVVCPQCLAVCSYENGGLVVRDDSDAPYRHTANAGTIAHEQPRFCHSCGKQLPTGISFCPYCGTDLSAPFETPHQAPAPVIEPVIEEPAPVQPIQEVSTHHVEEPASTPAPQESSSSQMEAKLRTITHRYNTMHPHLQQHGTMPGRAFKFFAYAAIIALLALLVYIIIAGLSLETAV